jgi:hypothetical protein
LIVEQTSRRQAPSRARTRGAPCLICAHSLPFLLDGRLWDAGAAVSVGPSSPEPRSGRPPPPKVGRLEQTCPRRCPHQPAAAGTSRRLPSFVFRSSRAAAAEKVPAGPSAKGRAGKVRSLGAERKQVFDNFGTGRRKCETSERRTNVRGMTVTVTPFGITVRFTVAVSGIRDRTHCHELRTVRTIGFCWQRLQWLGPPALLLERRRAIAEGRVARTGACQGRVRTAGLDAEGVGSGQGAGSGAGWTGAAVPTGGGVAAESTARRVPSIPVFVSPVGARDLALAGIWKARVAGGDARALGKERPERWAKAWTRRTPPRTREGYDACTRRTRPRTRRAAL